MKQPPFSYPYITSGESRIFHKSASADLFHAAEGSISHPAQPDISLKKPSANAEGFFLPPGSRCPRFFTRSVKQAGALPNAFAVPWRIKRGHGISFIGPGLHFLKCGENRKAVVNPRMSAFIIFRIVFPVKYNL